MFVICFLRYVRYGRNITHLLLFILKGFDALGYQEHLDYGLVRSTNPDDNKALVRVNVFRDHRQTIQV